MRIRCSTVLAAVFLGAFGTGCGAGSAAGSGGSGGGAPVAGSSGSSGSGGVDAGSIGGANGAAGRAAGSTGGAGGGSAPAGPKATAVSNNGDTICAITESGGLECWGDNSFGALGNGTTTRSPVPVQVMGLTSGVSAVAAGGGFTCAVVAGAVQCWGDNSAGLFGDGTKNSSLVPVPIPTLTAGIAAISAGPNGACAITTGGALQCWGFNFSGQLGNGTTTPNPGVSTPVQVTGLTGGVTAVSVGEDSSCAVVAGGVKCWGANLHGQLGNGSTKDSSTPVDVTGLSSGVAAISVLGAQEYPWACALTTAGGVQCWGANTFGQLGNGSMVDSPTPVQVVGLTGGVVAQGGNYAALADGGLVFWDATTNGVPSAIGGFATIVATGISFAINSGCLIDASGHLVCWGDDSSGQYGNGTVTANYHFTNVPVPVVLF